MGQEVLYCYKCQRRVLGADFAKGHAYQVGNQVSCSACAADLLHALPGKEREQLMAKMFQATHGRASDAPPSSGTHERVKSTHRLPPVPSAHSSAGSPGPLIAGVAVVAAVIVGVVIMMSGSKEQKPLPPPPPPVKLAQPSAPPPPPAPAISPEEQRRIDAARAALKRAREFSRANPNELKAQIQEWEKARAASEGTPFFEEAKRELAGLAARLQEGTAREQAAALNAGLVGYWKLDEGAGNTAGDSSPAASFGALTGGVSWTSGRCGGAVAFDGTGSVVVPHRDALNAFPLSVCAWARTSGLKGGIVNKYQSGSLLGYQIYLYQGEVRAWYFRNPENYVWDAKKAEHGISGGTINDGAWHHLAFVVDMQGGRLYVDGGQKAALAWTGTPGSSSSAKDFLIGRYPGRVDAPDAFFQGSIDDVRVYNRALRDEELRWLATPN